ncbi:rod-binding protein [Thermohalobacter berrensis]|uniref:Flagellar protein FlgJ N-terminal domain-containing protein n=1 Tax=Thermohalobacter berrensis TaxID=99594 RepID=A0A419T0D9_9FIRM|nr:rod-binding protein [Thermohalobacter berrensis]RKD30922.1 hypothetical protein BET03_13040 [Thermohalobacter berrensis]
MQISNNPNITKLINKANSQKNKTQTTSLQKKLESAYKKGNNEELKKACQEFESIFLHMLLKQMRSTIPDGGLTQKSAGREIFEDMYDQEIAKKATQKGQGIGLAKLLYEQLK